MRIFFGLLKFQIYFWGVLELPDIFGGVKGRCWAPPMYEEKLREPPPPWGPIEVRLMFVLIMKWGVEGAKDKLDIIHIIKFIGGFIVTYRYFWCYK